MPDPLFVQSVEYPITEHCTLRCLHCDHAAPLLPKRFVETDRFRRDLEAIAPALQANELRILGGEPLLHPDLLEILAAGRASRVSRFITLITNGTLLHNASPQIWKLIDRLWLTVYPGIRLPMSLDALRRACAENEVFLDVRDTPWFRQTLVADRCAEPAVVQRIFNSCMLTHMWRCYTICDGRFYRCSPAPVVKRWSEFKQADFDGAEDGVPLEGNPLLREQLQRYLEETSPLAACAYCLGSSGPRIAHRQLEAAEGLKGIPVRPPL